MPNFFRLFALIIIATAAACNAAFGSVNETEHRALLAIKSQIKSDPFGALSSWNDSIHFCDWQGVTCGKKHGRVVALELPSFQLMGALSPYIGNFSFLRVLDLSDNAFHGILSQEISLLSKLQILQMASNYFQGELPVNMTNNVDLSFLNLSSNGLVGRIPGEVGALEKLTKIDLSVNHFRGTIPPSLGNLSALTDLKLAGNNIDGTIPPELGKLSNLFSLLLSSNNLSGSIPTSIFNISSICTFSVGANNLSGSLPSDLFMTLPNLQLLNLRDNEFSGPIPSSINNASQLVRFTILQNSFSGPVPVDMGGLKNLELLSFGVNPLGTEGGDDLRFFTSLTNSTKLSVLSLYQSGLKGTLPDCLANFSTALTILQLDLNFISGVIPSGIGNLVNLQLLSLNANMLGGEIPESIGNIHQMQEITIAINNISGKLPQSIGNLTSLSRLVLNENMLEGTIPNSLGNCTSLYLLELAQNRFVGPVPEELFGLTSLSVGMSLSYNYLTGPIPYRVGKLVNLQQLFLWGNDMSGELPPTLGDCRVLEWLDLGNNQFTGTIPASLSALRGIQVLDVSRNNLSGQIPWFLGDLPFLNTLNLSFNNFKGEVPVGNIFGNLSAVSVAGNDELCGGPPTLQLPKCKEGNRMKGRSQRTVLIIGVIVPIVLLLFVGVIIARFCQTKRSKKETTLALSENQLPKLSYAELSRATDGFSPANLLGEGSFGTVYKGLLPGKGQIVAVKVLKLNEHGATKSFMAECEALKNIRHRNLVKTITSCSSINFSGNDFKALVYEYMPNGSLEKWLHPVENEAEKIDGQTTLTVLQRLNIAIDVATALDYLHHQCHRCIVHCDLKPSNILLDNDFVAHLSDFGLAKFLMARVSATQSSSSVIRGTIGYIPPEYGIGGEVSTLGDVYSFGILLLELFTGKRPTTFSGEFGLREFVERFLPHGLNHVLDPLLCLEAVRDELHQCLVSVLGVGLTCSAAQPNERIGMEEVAAELQKARGVIQVRTR